MKILLDTHIVLWAAVNHLSQTRQEYLADPHHEIFISGISLWEITKLYELERIHFDTTLEDFLLTVENHPRFKIVPLRASILAEIPIIAKKMHKDPADQMIVATAKKMQLALMTDDKKIKKLGLVKTI